MSIMFWIGFFLVMAFLLQGFLGFLQIKNFSVNFGDLRKKGKVLIGKNPKRIRSGSLILMAIDKEGSIKEARIMKGVTVFAKFKQLKKLQNMNVVEVAANHQIISSFDKLTQQCILNAYRNYINFKTGKLTTEDLDTSVNIFSIPILEKIKIQSMQIARFVKRNFIREK